MRIRLFALLLGFLLAAATTVGVGGPAAAAPPPATAVVQSNQGTGDAAGFTASLRKTPAAGNAIVIVVGLNGAASSGVLEADDVAHVIDAAETSSAFQVAGAPYAIVFAADVQSGVKTWRFHGPSQPVTWLVAEFSGLQKFESGVPRWDGAPFSSDHAVGTGATSLSTGQGQPTANPHELLISPFAGRVTAGVPPTVTSFANTTSQPGAWTRLGNTVATSSGGANHRLDVAFKVVDTSAVYDCTATWSAAPAGMSGLITGFYAL